jgi:hypothetical protein
MPTGSVKAGTAGAGAKNRSQPGNRSDEVGASVDGLGMLNGGNLNTDGCGAARTQAKLNVLNQEEQFSPGDAKSAEIALSAPPLHCKSPNCSQAARKFPRLFPPSPREERVGRGPGRGASFRSRLRCSASIASLRFIGLRIAAGLVRYATCTATDLWRQKCPRARRRACQGAP